MNKDDQKKLSTITSLLFENPDSFEFRVPVDHKKLGLVDYPLIVSYPMDLGTAKKKLLNNQYNLIEEFIDDVQMIWHNCKVYNAQGSWIFNLADRLERYFKKLIKSHLPQVQITQKKGDQTVPEIEQISFSQKNKFCQNMKKLTQEQLGTIVQMIVTNCPLAYNDVDNSNCQIIVDNIDLDTFHKIDEKIQQWINNIVDPGIQKKVKLNKEQ